MSSEFHLASQFTKFWLCVVLALKCTPEPQICEASGKMDLSFNGSGFVNLTLGSGNAFGRALAIQADARILLGGYFHNGNNFDFAVTRFFEDGTLDTAFGEGGQAITPVSAGDDYGLCMAIQRDGKFLLAGYTETSGDRAIAVVRYLSSGLIDETFGSRGKQTIQAGQTRSTAWSIAVTEDDKILLAGWADEGGRDVFVTIRLNENGGLDTTFASDGKSITAVGSVSSSGRGLAIQSDGKIIVGGFATIEGSVDFVVVRYDSNGLIDTTFADSGVSVIPFGVASTDYAYTILIQAGSKIVVAGSSLTDGKNDFAMARLDENGQLDLEFGVEGKTLLDFSGDNDFALKAAAQVDEKLILVGSARVQGASNIAVARFNSDGTPDLTFGNEGKVTTPVSPTSNASWDVAVTPNGRILVAGWSQASAQYQMTLLRYVGTKPIEDWRYSNFGTTLNRENASNDSDPDHDGFCNLIEYAFGTSPKRPGGLAFPVPQADSNEFLVEFQAPEGVSDVRYDLEWSSSLENDDWSSLVNEAVRPSHRFRLMRSSNRKYFFRYQVTELP